jgi:hypothetical protein
LITNCMDRSSNLWKLIHPFEFVRMWMVCFVLLHVPRISATVQSHALEHPSPFDESIDTLILITQARQPKGSPSLSRAAHPTGTDHTHPVSIFSHAQRLPLLCSVAGGLSNHV